jgi:hypothetical protein
VRYVADIGAMLIAYKNFVIKRGHEISNLDVRIILELIFRRTLFYLALERCVVANTAINCLDS